MTKREGQCTSFKGIAVQIPIGDEGVERFSRDCGSRKLSKGYMAIMNMNEGGCQLRELYVTKLDFSATCSRVRIAPETVITLAAILGAMHGQIQ